MRLPHLRRAGGTIAVGVLLAACAHDQVAPDPTSATAAPQGSYQVGDDGLPTELPCLRQLPAPNFERRMAGASFDLSASFVSEYGKLTVSNTGVSMFEAGGPTSSATMVTRGLTDDGYVLADRVQNAAGDLAQPYLWREAEGWTPLPMPDGAITNTSQAMNNAREVVGYATVPTAPGGAARYTAWRWSAARGLELLGRPGTATESYAVAINAAGEIAGFVRIGGILHAATWANGSWTVLGAPVSGRDAVPQGNNDLGWVVGFHYPNFSSARAFVLRPGQGFQNLDRPPGAIAARAIDVNNDGLVAGWAQMSGGTYRAWTWKDGVYTLLGTVPGGPGGAFAYAVSEKGVVAGYAQTANNGAHAVAWNNSTEPVDLGKHTDACSSIGTAVNVGGQVGGMNYFGGTSASDPVLVRAARWNLVAPNAAPSTPQLPGQTGDEGGTLTFTATGASDPDGDPLTYTWTFGDGSPPETTTAPTVSHAYLDNGTYPVTLTVSDGKGGTATVSTTATVANARPVGHLAVAAPTVYCNQNASVTVSFADAGVNDRAWSYVVTWGDGTQTAGTASAQGQPLTLTKAYTRSGTFTVTYVVTDKDGAASAPVSATVAMRCNFASCTYTQGFWKNHEERWPAPFAPTAPFLKGTGAAPGHTWDGLFGQPVRGNSAVRLAHQWMAATLNRANGAPAPADLDAALASARAALFANTQASGALPSVKSSQFDAWAGLFDRYNNGQLTYPNPATGQQTAIPHCN